MDRRTDAKLLNRRLQIIDAEEVKVLDRISAEYWKEDSRIFTR
jgi:hypothetical protein